jgi:aminoglycoside N3'-acetyltransferase
VTEGDVVMVHASMRRVGGDATELVAALDAAVGDTGTLVMNLGAPESSADAPFDHLRSPADPDVGVLAEVFRTSDGTVVSDHPDARFGARGARAGELLAATPWNDYYGPGSALERLVSVAGKVLRLGADLETVTLLHYAEYVAPLPSKRRVRRTHWVTTPTGVVERSVECLDDSTGIVDVPGEDYFARLLRDYLATGRARTGTVGNAPSELLDATDLVAFAVDWMVENLVAPR